MSDEAFLGFRTLLSGTIIKIVYAVGFFLLTAAGLLLAVIPLLIYYADGPDGALPTETILQASGGLLLLSAGNVLWRLLCEAWILFFSLHEMLASLEKNIQTSNELLEGVARQLSAIEANTEQRHKETLARLSRTQAPARAISSESGP